MASIFTYRNFLNQTGNFDTDWVISVDNTTGSGFFGISGNKIFGYTLKSGEIYDPYGNILESYSPNSSFTIKNSISNGKDTLYFNNAPKYFFKSTNFFQNHNYNYFIIDPSGLDINFDFFVRGELTTLNVGFLNTRSQNENTNQIVNDVTGLIQNTKPGLNVKIFTGIISNPSYFFANSFPLSFNTSANFIVSTDSGVNNFGNFTDTIPITFSTNFGDVSFNLDLQNIYIPFIFNDLDLIPSGNIFATSDSFTSVLAKYGSTTGSFISLELKYISGVTGFYSGSIPASGFREDLISGYVTGSGFIEKVITTPVNLTGFNSFTSVQESKPVENIKITAFKYATGNVELYYDIDVTGLGSGIVYQNVLATGYTYIESSGYVPYSAPGAIPFTVYQYTGTGLTVDINGNPLTIVGVIPKTTNYVTASYSGDIDNVLLNPDQYGLKAFSGKHTGALEGLEIIGNTYVQLGTGYGAGYSKTGIVDANFYRFFEEGYYNFWKDVRGISGRGKFSDETKLITGLSGLLSCKIITEPIEYSGITEIEGTNHVYLYVSECSPQSPFFYYLATGTALNEVKLYTKVSTNKDGTSVFVEDDKVPKFINIKVQGNESGFSHLENINYLTGNSYGTGIRTRISHIGNTPSGSGYFSGIFSEGGCEESGIWEHNFVDFVTETGEFFANTFLSNYEVKVISAEDNIVDNYNFVEFNIIGNLFGNPYKQFSSSSSSLTSSSSSSSSSSSTNASNRISAGGTHSLALLKDGRVTAFGNNQFNETNVPVGIGNNAVGIAAGTYFSLALLKDGRVTGFGKNDFGQTDIPVGIANNATGIVAGGFHSLALLKDGSIVGWGNNTWGQTNIPFGIGTNATGIAAGYLHSLALLKDGSIVGWGYNDNGQTTIPFGIGTNAIAIAAGYYYSLALLKDGKVTGWGDNFYGELTIPVGIGTNAIAIAAGYYHSLALLKDGRVTGWGRNNFGQTTIPVGIANNATGIAAGLDYSVALLKDGSIGGWGRNNEGQINFN